MILGVGIDICQNNRVKLELAKKILNDKELVKFNEIKLDSSKIEYLSGRFAVKEALIKAFSSSGETVYMKDLIILNDETGRPYLDFPKFEGVKIHVSLSHERDYSVGFAILEKSSF
jgi:holo-[acyl-carrier protein] synthase